jgi:hypothetical protein
MSLLADAYGDQQRLRVCKHDRHGHAVRLQLSQYYGEQFTDPQRHSVVD